MEHLIAKTGLAVAIKHVLEELDLHKDQDAVKSMLIDIFSRKFADFKRRHTEIFGNNNLIAYYVVENQYPVGENDIHQYFRCLAYDVKMGNGALSIGKEHERKNFTIIQGYSRNQRCPKNGAPRIERSEHKRDASKRRQNYSSPKYTKPSKRVADDDCEKYLRMLQKGKLKKMMYK